MNFIEMFKQAKKMKDVLGKQQKELMSKQFEGQAGGGMVVVVMNGKMDVTQIRIDPELMRMQDIKMMQDLMKGAFNSALKQAQDAAQGAFASMMQGMNIDGAP